MIITGYIPALTDHLIGQFQSVPYPVELRHLSFPFLVLIPSVSALIEAYSLNWEVANGRTIIHISSNNSEIHNLAT